MPVDRLRPSKSLLAAAHAAADARAAHSIGVLIDGVRVDYARVMEHVRRAILAIEPADSVAALERAGVRVLRGETRFTGEGTIDAGGRVVRYRQALVATGAGPRVPDIPGIDTVGTVTSETVWDMPELPQRLAILGGGRIACELGQAFARLGSAVTILERSARILSAEDERVSGVIAEALRSDGVEIRTGAHLTEVHASARPDAAVDSGTPSHNTPTGTLLLDDGSALEFDALLVAAGSAPHTEGLGLDSVDVRLTPHGTVAVDSRTRTTNPRIWAAGDVTGRPRFTHTAGVHASTAATNAILGLSRKAAAPRLEPSVLFTQPEMASVGIRPAEAGKTSGLRVLTREHAEIDRAVAEAKTDGFTQLVVDRRGTLKGALVVGPRAGETLGELSLAVHKGLSTSDIASTTHAYPTYNDVPWNAAIENLRHRLRRQPIAGVMRLLAWLRRRIVKRGA